MTQLELQAAAMISLIQGVANVPPLVAWRKTELLEEGEGTSGAVILTSSVQKVMQRAHGGSVQWEYLWVVSVYEKLASVPNNASNIDVGNSGRPQLMDDVKGVLSTKTLSGSAVWDFDVEANGMWERQGFVNGCELSQFRVRYRAAEAS